MTSTDQYDAFLSYGRADDKAFVGELHTRLTKAGFRIWWDAVNMPNRGETFYREIQHAIDASTRLIAVIGPAAVKSRYVRAEWDYAQLVSKVVVPVLRQGENSDIPKEVRRDDYTLVPAELSAFHCPDMRPSRPFDEAFAELERILRQPITAPGDPHYVPQLPEDFLPRPDVLKPIGEALMADAFHPVVVEAAAQRTVVVHGLPGAGKSVVAATFATSVSIRRSFGDGVVWLEVGQDPKPLTLWKRLGMALDDAEAHYADADTAANRLGELLRDRCCLIVLDDVWDKRPVEPVWNALGSRCRLLMTSRDRGVATAFQARECFVDVLSPPAALSLLSQWSASAESELPAIAADVAHECGYLPLALALAGAMVRDKVLWEDILQALREADLSFLQHDLANYPHPQVMRALQASVDFLGQSNAKAAHCYTDLAVFVPQKRVPESAVVTLWTAEGGLSPREARALLALLDQKGLLKLEGTPPARFAELHDLQWDYVRARTPDVTEVHARLVKAYRALAAGGWATLPDDGYIFDRLAFHLRGARDHAGLYALISRPWMQAQFLRTQSHRAFAADADLAVATAKAERPVNLPEVVRAAVVQATLGSFSSQIPPEALAVMAGDGEDPAARARAARAAHGFATLIVDADQRGVALLLIAEVVQANGDAGHAATLLAEALQVAIGIGGIAQVLKVWGGLRGWAEVAQLPDQARADDQRGPLRLAAAGELRRAGQNELARPLELASVREAPAGGASGDLPWDLAIGSVEAGDLPHAFDLLAGETASAAAQLPAQRFADAIVGVQRANEAVQLTARIRDQELQGGVLFELASALARAGDDRTARSLALSLRPPLRDGALQTMAVWASRGGRVQVAQEALETMSETTRPMGLAAAARECVSAADPEVPRRLARRAAAEVGVVEVESWRASTIAAAAWVLATLGDREEAVGLARDALARASHLPSVNEAIRVLREAGLALVEAGEFQAAESLLYPLEGDDGRFGYLATLAPALARKHQGALAVDALEALEDRDLRKGVLRLLVPALVEVGALDEAARSLTLVDKSNQWDLAGELIPPLIAAGKVQLASDVAHRTDDPKLLSTLALAWVGGGEPDLALQAARTAAQGDQAGIFASLAVAFFASGDLARANVALQGIGEDQKQRAVALYGMAKHHLAHGELVQAFEKARAIPLPVGVSHQTEVLLSASWAAIEARQLDLARDIADTLAWVRDRRQALSQVAFALARDGKREAAHALLTRTVEMSLAVPAGSVREDALGRMAQGLAEAGRLDDALSVVGALRSELEKGNLLRAVARKQAETDPDRAIATAGSLEAFSHFGVRWIEADLLLDVAEILLRQDRAPDAVAITERARRKTLAAFERLDSASKMFTSEVPAQLARAYAIFTRGSIARSGRRHFHRGPRGPSPDNRRHPGGAGLASRAGARPRRGGGAGAQDRRRAEEDDVAGEAGAVAGVAGSPRPRPPGGRPGLLAHCRGRRSLVPHGRGQPRSHGADQGRRPRQLVQAVVRRYRGLCRRRTFGPGGGLGCSGARAGGKHGHRTRLAQAGYGSRRRGRARSRGPGQSHPG